jgi:hypothetical protein
MEYPLIMKYLFLLFLLFNFLREGDAKHKNLEGDFNDSTIVRAITEKVFGNTTIGDHGGSFKRRRRLLDLFDCPAGSYLIQTYDSMYGSSYNGYCNLYNALPNVVDSSGNLVGRKVGTYKTSTGGTNNDIMNWFNQNRAECQDQDGCVLCWDGTTAFMWSGSGGSCPAVNSLGMGGTWANDPHRCPQAGSGGFNGEHGCIRCGLYGVCTACPSGKWSNTIGAQSSSTCNTWSTCGSGTRVSNINARNHKINTVCTNCLAGKYKHSLYSAVGVGDCDTCSDTTYQNQEGQSGCKQCSSQKAAGDHTMLSGNSKTAASDCYPANCAKGYYRYGNSVATYTCKSCTSGNYQDEDGYAGTSCSPTSTCGQGRRYSHSSYADNSNCDSKCLAGTYQNENGHRTTTCKGCDPGYYQNQQEQSGCKACGIGKYLDSGGNDAESDCKRCAAGKFLDSTGNTAAGDCKPCAAGWITNTGTSTGASTCDKCGIGKFSTQSNVNSCTFCLAGDYQPTDGQTSCTACGIGALKNKQAQTTTSVGIGNYRSGTGAYECINCQNGYDNQDGWQCNACIAGKYATSGNTCDDCNPGYITNRLANTGAWTCTACGATDTYTYSPNSQTACATCPSGSITTRSSTSDTAVVTYDATHCNACTTGKYSDDANVACATCGAGHVTARGTSTTSLVSSAATHCNACPVSHWTPNNQIACALCPSGSETNTLTAVGASTCTPCIAGKWTSDSSIACQAWSICPAGQYKVEHTDSSDGRCEVCVDGEFCPGGIESFVAISSGHQDVSVSESECSAYATSVGKTYSTAISDQASNQWDNYIKGCQQDSSNIYWNPSTTSEIACGTGGNNCVQKTLGNVNYAILHNVESFVLVSSGAQDVSVSESECSAYATSIGADFGYDPNMNNPKGCFNQGNTNVYWNNQPSTKECGAWGVSNCVQKTLGNVIDAHDPDFVGIRMFCAPESEGIDGVSVRSSHANSCVACNHGFTGSKRITETLTGQGDESLTSAECEAHAGSASFTEGDFADKPWGCSKVGDDYFWNERIYNTNVGCNDANTLCVQHVPDQGTADCAECPLGSYEVGGVCIPWQYTDQTECPDGAAFVIGNSGISSTCVTDFYYVPLEPSDGTLDLTIDSILCGADQALLDPQGNIVCTSCDRQGFLFIYGGPIVTTKPAYQRGPCCINSHHDVCTKMLDEYHLKCGASYTKSVNKCV